MSVIHIPYHCTICHLILGYFSPLLVSVLLLSLLFCSKYILAKIFLKKNFGDMQPKLVYLISKKKMLIEGKSYANGRRDAKVLF